MRMKYIVTKTEKRPGWLRAGILASGIVYLTFSIADTIWKGKHTDVTEVEE